MKLIEYMSAKNKTKEIELVEPRPFSIHQQTGDGDITHVGWCITVYKKEEGTTKAGKPKKPKRYDIVFTPEEAYDWRHSLDVMLARFVGGVEDLLGPALAQAAIDAEDDDEEDEDD